MGEAADELLQASFCMGHESSVVSEEHLAHEYLSDFGLGTKTGDVVQFAVRPSVYVDALFSVLKSMVKQHGEEYTDECGRKNTTLFHHAAYWE